VNAVWFVARTEMRHRWLGALVLVVLVGIVGGALLASAAGARRTSSALERFEFDTDAATLEFNVKNGVTSEQLAELKRVPGVARVGLLRQLAMFNADVGFIPTGGPIDKAWGRAIDRPRLVSGRIAHGADEVNIGEALAQRMHLGVGDTLPFQSFSPQDVREQLCTPEFDPTGPAPNLRVAGIVRRPLDLGARGDIGGVVVVTRPFMAKYGPDVGTFVGTVIRLRTERGDADVRRVTNAARSLFGGAAGEDAALADAPNCVAGSSQDIPNFGVLGIGVEGQGAQSAVDITTAALWVLAGVTAAAGLVAIAFALARRMADEVENEDTLRALGLERRQRWAATVVQAAPIAIGGALLAIVVGWLASPLFPIGVARDAEPAPGLDFDTRALLLGALVVVFSVMVVGAVAAAVVTRRRARAAARPSTVVRAMADAGVAPSVAVGVGFALGRGRSRAIPVWSTIAAITIGVVGIVAAMVFASSLDRLVETPSRYGWTWGVVLDGYGGADDGNCPKSDPASNDPGITALAQYCYANNISIAGRPAVGSSFRQVRGQIEPTIVHGRAPRNPREMALGAKLLGSIGKSIGDQVVVASGDPGLPTGTGSLKSCRPVSTTGGGSGLVATFPGKKKLKPRWPPKNISPRRPRSAAPLLNSFPCRPSRMSNGRTSGFSGSPTASRMRARPRVVPTQTLPTSSSSAELMLLERMVMNESRSERCCS